MHPALKIPAGGAGAAPPQAARGFSLIELLVVMTIAAIALTIGVPSLQSFIADQHVRVTTADLAQDMAYARASAIASSKDTIIQPNTPGAWTSGWVIYTDMDSSNTLTGGDLTIKQTTPTTGTLLICTNVAEFATNVIFRPDGTVVRTSAVTANDGITVSDTLGSGNAANFKIRTLYFGPGGRITAVLQNGGSNGGGVGGNGGGAC